jgi:formate-dependent nitrite reductase membrane component NrfD
MPDGSTRPEPDPSKAWDGPTYYGRPQLKPAPFNNYVVGGYIFLAGLSGGSMIVSTIAEQAGHHDGVGRRGRFLSLLAPTIGSAMLVWDLHTPQRAMNMMRVAKKTSPMSIGTWILLSFTAFAMPAAAAEIAANYVKPSGLLRRLARIAAVPAALFGTGLGTYTAALLAATSVPLWAAAPRSLASRFASSTVATGASALSLGEGNPRTRRALDIVTLAALGVELMAAHQSHKTYERTGVAGALDSPAGRVEYWGGHVAGTMVPAGLKAAAVLLGPKRGRWLSRIASVAAMAGSATFRISIMEAGNISATKPDISFRFSQPENLPKTK